MWRETKILLIDDDSVRRRDLAVILNFLGEENLSAASSDWQQAVGSLASSREVLCVLVGDVSSAGGASSLLKTLAVWDEFLPILLLGDISSVDLPEDQRRRVLSGMRTKTWTGYAAKPRLSRYSMGLSAPREIFIRFSLYQRMYES
ncbi:hypothetical protein HBN70_12540, partial [Pseudomonas lundensis]|nr:hypothetical protein [Pseudomonas lundensis]